MKKLFFISAISIAVFSQMQAQSLLRHSAKATRWVDSVYNSLTPDQRLAQLMVMRESSVIDGKPVIYDDSIIDDIKKYNIGGICLFQGAPATQAALINKFQSLAQTPIIVCIDGETGLGMRMEGIEKIPDQMTLGAMRHSVQLVYKIGKAIGLQCKRAGINVNYAPDVDINNNPNNPVIGYRSFGQDKYVVADYGVAIMKGMQSVGVMACAKHFPGHGDVDVDSHLDLPVIHKSLESLDTLELYPFKKIFNAGVGSVMIAHLSIPAIDSTPHLASSLSPKFVNGLLRKQMNFQGISFTDALGMKGVAKYFPQGEIAVKSLEAGNDMLCLPEDIPASLEKINVALKDGRLNWNDLEKRIKKVLYAKYNLGLHHLSNIDTVNVSADLNKDVAAIRKEVAKKSLTAVALENNQFKPLKKEEKIAYIAIGENTANTISSKLKTQLNASVFTLSFKTDDADIQHILTQLQQGNFDRVIVGIHHFNKQPAHNFYMKNPMLDAINKIVQIKPSALAVVFGNPYMIKNFANYKNIIACYEDDDIFENNAFEFLMGESPALGRLPVSVTPSIPYGTGILVKVK